MEGTKEEGVFPWLSWSIYRRLDELVRLRLWRGNDLGARVAMVFSAGGDGVSV
uniref:Uncharacterized protein n=1 Tax=Arundo donax TaxID=35708 RepID=A0A0A9DNA4_ARUDO